ncbi:MAG: DUF86 domain-containing protein [Nanoarchaeota archaeon]|nr:DUF86 domain-containing protein [Nanoarchaeota archaeon]
MDDIIKIQKNIEIIFKYLKILNEFDIKNSDEFTSKTHDNLAISMSLFTILNACIEIGEELISIKNLEIPMSYKEIFTILHKNNILSQDTSTKMSNYMYYRNMIAHQYDEFDLSKIYYVFENKEIFIEFIEEIKISLE